VDFSAESCPIQEISIWTDILQHHQLSKSLKNAKEGTFSAMDKEGPLKIS